MAPTARVVLLPSFILIVLGIIGLVAIDHQLRGSMALRVQNELRRMAESSLVAIELSDRSLSIENVDLVAKHIGLPTRTRITFIDSSGKVMGDSSVGEDLIESMSNHLDRVEILQAKELGVGDAIRYSNSLRDDFFYVAIYKSIKVNGEDIYYYARAAVPVDVLKLQITQMRMALSSILLAGVIIMSAIAFLIIRWGADSTLRRQVALEKAIDEKTQEIERMHDLDSLLNASSDLVDARKVVNKVIPTLLRGTSGSVSIYKSSRNQLKMQLFWGEKWQDSVYFNSDQCWALRKGHEHLSRLDSPQVECEHFTLEKTTDSLCIPLIAHGETIGVMHVLQTNFDEDKSGLAKAIAKRLAMSIANIELKTSLRQLAFKDPLTRLYNRRYLFETLQQWVSISQRKKTEIGIIMIDLDHFKPLNDTYGHDIGDKVLKVISQYLLETIRASDIACRYGGEEFCIAISDTNANDLIGITQKLCEGMSGVTIEINRTQRINVTGSLGASIYTKECNTIENTIIEADEALYTAKEEGRNCVRFSTFLNSRLDESEPI